MPSRQRSSERSNDLSTIVALYDERISVRPNHYGLIEVASELDGSSEARFGAVEGLVDCRDADDREVSNFGIVRLGREIAQSAATVIWFSSAQGAVLTTTASNDESLRPRQLVSTPDQPSISHCTAMRVTTSDEFTLFNFD